MQRVIHRRAFWGVLGAASGAVLLLAGPSPARPLAGDSEEQTNVIIMVRESSTGEPIANARLTLQFHEPGNPMKLKRRKYISFSAKTNAQGRYKFTGVTKGTVRLLVTADRHQSFGGEFELEKDNQVFEVKLRKPQPLL